MPSRKSLVAALFAALLALGAVACEAPPAEDVDPLEPGVDEPADDPLDTPDEPPPDS